MNGTTPPRIEIFAPFEAAFELTKKILFQPFDLTKWLTIGFAAFLAALGDGSHGGGGFNYRQGFNQPAKGTAPNFSRWHELVPSWLTVGVIICIVAVIFVVMLLFMWLGSRGRFMFIDCIVRNRGAIVEPWHEFRREANALFLFQLAAFVVVLCLWALLALPWIIPYLLSGHLPGVNVARVIFLICGVLLFVLLGIIWAFILWFMAPVMYRQLSGPVAACSRVLGLMASYPGPFVLYILFVLVLVLAGLIGSCLVTCLTCCLAALPYIGTVILLPLYVFYYSYTLLFLRQFGPDYDAWGNISVAPSLPPLEPPVQS